MNPVEMAKWEKQDPHHKDISVPVIRQPVQ